MDQNYISLLYGSLRRMQNCDRMYAAEYRRVCQIRDTNLVYFVPALTGSTDRNPALKIGRQVSIIYTCTIQAVRFSPEY